MRVDPAYASREDGVLAGNPIFQFRLTLVKAWSLWWLHGIAFCQSRCYRGPKHIFIASSIRSIFPSFYLKVRFQNSSLQPIFHLCHVSERKERPSRKSLLSRFYKNVCTLQDSFSQECSDRLHFTSNKAQGTEEDSFLTRTYRLAFLLRHIIRALAHFFLSIMLDFN